MKRIAYFDKNLQGSDFSSLDEVIIATREFSRQGTIDFNELPGFIDTINTRMILEWDILLSEDDFPRYEEMIQQIDLDKIAAIRVQDIGVLQFVIEQTNKPIQLILEAGNRNTIGIKKWIDLVGERLERIVLSPELSKEDLERIINEVKIPTEVLVFGKILLFYSPRKLLSSQFGENSKKEIHAIGKSEESPHRGFQLIENIHGTFMYNPKDLNLLNMLDQLEEVGVDFIRFDNRGFDYGAQKLLLRGDYQELLDFHPRPMIKGFFHRNKTDVLFKKLKNQKLLKKDDSYLGEIVDVIKNKQITIDMKNQKRPLKTGDMLILITPEGRKKEFEVSRLMDCLGSEIDKKSGDGLVMIPYPANLSIKTAVYWKDSFE